MPYANVPDHLTAKMDSCVQKVMRQGNDKKSAIAICYRSIVGKEANTMTETNDTAQSNEAEKTQTKDRAKGYVPYGITSFDQLDEWRKARDKAEEVYDLTSDLNGLIDSILYDPEIEDKGEKVAEVAKEYSIRMKMVQNKEVEVEVKDTKSLVDKITAVIKSLLPTKEHKTSPMMVWKETDGTYRWLARYSNNFKDDDNPPDIIAEKSHKRFVEMVDKGEYPLPELWLWHVPEWKCGQATAVAYDDNGFAVAIGYFDKGKENVAEWIMNQKNVAVSHAMPAASIKRDPDNSSIIVEHQTVEISPLPLWAAANKLTGFIVLDGENKEADMAIPKAKRDSLVNDWGIEPGLLDRLEAQNLADAEKALAEQRERKEQSETPVESAAQAEEVEPTEQAEQEEKEAADQPPTRREIADAIANVLLPFKESLDSVSERIKSVEASIKELEADDSEKIAKTAAGIPAASLGAMIAQSVIGKSAAAVDGRSSLAKSKPKEKKSAADEGMIGISFIDEMIAESDQE